MIRKIYLNTKCKIHYNVLILIVIEFLIHNFNNLCAHLNAYKRKIFGSCTEFAIQNRNMNLCVEVQRINSKCLSAFTWFELVLIKSIVVNSVAK